VIHSFESLFKGFGRRDLPAFTQMWSSGEVYSGTSVGLFGLVYLGAHPHGRDWLTG